MSKTVKPCQLVYSITHTDYHYDTAFILVKQASKSLFYSKIQYLSTTLYYAALNILVNLTWVKNEFLVGKRLIYSFKFQQYYPGNIQLYVM